MENTNKIFEELCLKGKKIDDKLLSGSPQIGEEMKKDYENLLNELLLTKKLDSYILSKITLSYLKILIISNNSEKALEIWTKSNDENKLWNLGIEMIEKAPSITMKDMILYEELGAYLNASNLILDSDDEKRKKVDYMMGRICDYHISNNKMQELFYALGNWIYLIKKIYHSETISEESKIKEYLLKLPQDIIAKIPQRLIFSIPDDWILPPLVLPDSTNGNIMLSSEKMDNINTIHDNQLQNIFYKLFSPKGRINRMQYLKYNLIIFVGVFLFFMILLALGVNIEIIDRMPNSIFLIPYFPIMIKRLQDIDYKGWWALVPLVPLVILFIPGTKGENRFGPEPRVKK